jgi:hypothetical protein
MAESHFSSANKPQVYDLLSRLNASFARVMRNVALLDKLGIFDAQTITHIQTRSEELRADANHRLLGKLHGIEQQDCTRFTQTS